MGSSSSQSSTCSWSLALRGSTLVWGPRKAREGGEAGCREIWRVTEGMTTRRRWRWHGRGGEGCTTQHSRSTSLRACQVGAREETADSQEVTRSGREEEERGSQVQGGRPWEEEGGEVGKSGGKVTWRRWVWSMESRVESSAVLRSSERLATLSQPTSCSTSITAATLPTPLAVRGGVQR